DPLALGFVVALAKRAEHAAPLGAERALALAVAHSHRDRLIEAVPDCAHSFLGDFAYRARRVETDRAADRVEHLRPPVLDFSGLVYEWQDRPRSQRLGLIRAH